MSNEIQERVNEVVARTLKIDLSRVTPESRFVEDLGADSMQSVELIASFEEEFDIDMDERKALDVKTVNKAVDFISAHLD